jgi:hypothetical protein
MSQHIDTREGWREINVRGEEASIYAVYQLAEYDKETGNLKRAWVRESPVPPLPTEPYTVVRVTRCDEEPTLVGAVLHLDPKDDRYPWVGEGDAWPADTIQGFEVLSEPRTVTAMAMSTWFRDEYGSTVVADVIARVFGATS